MMSGDPTTGRFRALDELAEEFIERCRRNERPSLQDYVDRFPEMATEIRELFPALIEVESVERAIDDSLDLEQRDDTDEARWGAALPMPLARIGDYQIIREIGRGGMGVVYEAEQLSLGRRVALKILPWVMAKDSTALLRFRREARSAARLHHTNIVPVFDIGEVNGVAFYAMQYIQGQGLDLVLAEVRRLRDESRRAGPTTPGLARSGDAGPAALARSELASAASWTPNDVAHALLSDQFAKAGSGSIAPTPDDTSGATEVVPPGNLGPGGPEHSPPGSAQLPGGAALSTSEVRGGQPYFRAVAEIGHHTALALAYAHGHGVVHRDVKPSNLLLDAAGTVWIADFGLATNGDDGLTASGDILGTLRYMAPERLRGQGDALVDIYALGITLYEMLTLRAAFDSVDRLRLIQQIRDQEPPRPRSIDARIPHDLETVVLKAIEKDPRRRYASAEALGEDLRRFLAGEPIRARQVGEVERAWKWARRRPGIAALIGLVVASLLAGTIVSTTFALIADQRAEDARQAESKEKVRTREAQAAGVRAETSARAAQAAEERAIVERDNSRHVLAGLAVDRGLALAEEGQPERGLHWLLEALRDTPSDGDFARMVRLNLTAWMTQVHEPLWLRIDDQHFDGYSAITISPDGRSFVTTDRIAQSGAIALTIRETSTGRFLTSYPDAHLPIRFRPDGKVLLMGWGGENRLRAIELATGRPLWTSEPIGPSLIVAVFRPDGQEFALLSRSEKFDKEGLLDEQVQNWDATVGKPVGPARRGRFFLSGHQILTMTTSGNGSDILSTFDPNTGTSVEVYQSHGIHFFWGEERVVMASSYT